MASKVWLLVEWLDDNKIFPTYDVVSVERRASKQDDLQIASEIMLCIRRKNPRKAKIVSLSENKLFVHEQKRLLEDQDQRLKEALQKMRVSGDYSLLDGPSRDPPPRVINARQSDSSSEDEKPLKTLSTKHRKRTQTRDQSTSASSPKITRKQRKTNTVQNIPKNSHSMAPPLRSSTPMPSTSAKKASDETTQTHLDGQEYTDNILMRIQSMEDTIRKAQKCLAELGERTASNLQLANAVIETMRERDESMAESTDDDYDNDDEDVDEQVGAEAEPVVVDGNADPQPRSSSNMDIVETPASNALQVRRMSAHTTNTIDTSTNDDDLVPIGRGYARVPQRLLRDVNWHTPTMATRQLLQAIFPRSVLATHSLTGRQSPAFMNRPAKKILDPRLVEDIVRIVTTRCGVPRNLVRNTITIKCTDEAKLYRNRQLNKKQRKNSPNVNDENRPPSRTSSEGSNNRVKD